MPPAKSTDPLPAEQNLSSAREILELQNVYPLTSKSLDRARKAALLRNHPDKCLDGEPLHTCDTILNAYELLKQEAEEGDLHAQMNEDRLEKIKLTFGQWFCTSECEECLATAKISFSCAGCSRRQGHEAECKLKKAFSSCKTQQEKIRFYQIASHEGFKVAVSDLSKAHGAAAGRAKALEEVRAQQSYTGMIHGFAIFTNG